MKEIDLIERPILITGCARSGTSMCAGLIHLSGAFGGDMRGPTRYNKKGMFENKIIVNEYVKPLFRRLGYDPLGQNPLPDVDRFKTFGKEYPKRWRNNIINLIQREGYPGGYWFYKGAKMCLMWPLWHEAFPKATWIIVRRNADDIIASCMRTAFMRGYKNYSGWLGWVAEHEKRFQEMLNAGLKIYQVWPQEAINGDFTSLQSVINNLGLKWDYEKIREFINPSLWHRSKIKGDRKLWQE